MDETNFVTVEAPALIGIGAQSIVEQAKQLGLTWTMQRATVMTSTTTTGSIKFDADTTAVNCINLADLTLPAGTRVMGLITPTGNYIISALTQLAGEEHSGAAITVGGSTSSTAFVAMPESATLLFTKGSNDTKLRIDFSVTVFVSALGAVQIGALVDSTPFFGAGLAIVAINVHTLIAGSVLATGIAAGQHTVTMAWAKTSGGGTVSQNNGDFTTFNVSEVW